MAKRNLLITIIAIFIILLFCYYKNIFFGNNNINKTTLNIAENILNIKSYQATLKVIVKSNKNTNEYNLKQDVSENISIQEVIDDESNLKIINKGNNLTIKNTKLNIEKVYENYEWVTDGNICLTTFIDDYKKSQNSKYYEKDNEIIFETYVANAKNKYICKKKLYVDKVNNRIEKMEILDSKQNWTINIIYNEIEFNN